MKPLEGVRVVDFTVAVAGPIASFVLADLGAEVIKVEEAARGQMTRADMPRREGAPDRPWNRLSNFNELNRGKLSLAVDVARPEGREVFLRLAGLSDIVIENWSPRVVGNLGIDYAQARRYRDDIIYISMPAFGKTGPYAEMRSYGPGIDAMSGLSHLTGYVDGPPLKPGNYYCDQNAGLHAAFAAMAALHHRRLTGEGQYIELPMLEGEIQVFGEALMDVALNGREPARLGNRHPSIAPHGVYPCRPNPLSPFPGAPNPPAPFPRRDGGGSSTAAGLGSPPLRGEGPARSEGDGRSDEWVTIVAADDAQWHALCGAIGRPELTRDPRFADPIARYRHQDELDAIIGAWTVEREKHEVQRTLQAAGVSAAAALTPSEMFEDPHIRARGLFEFVEHSDADPFPHTRVAFKLSGTPAPITRSGPPFAEGNDYVLRELLRMSAEEVSALRERRVIVDPHVSA
jgi:benzylsuccinate CoA-transferase BbsF subunit